MEIDLHGPRLIKGRMYTWCNKNAGRQALETNGHAALTKFMKKHVITSSVHLVPKTSDVIHLKYDHMPGEICLPLSALKSRIVALEYVLISNH
jgi:hypothetical protein